MRWEEVHVICCCEMVIGAEIVQEKSINLQFLHWATPHGKVPQSSDDSYGRLLCTKETNVFAVSIRLLEKMAEVSGSFFKRCSHFTVSGCM